MNSEMHDKNESPESEYVGCYKDSVIQRDFPVNKGMELDDLTPLKCSKLCHKYHFYAMQNGRECWCGDASWEAQV